MESQKSWPVSAAISAFTGLALVFGLWWWYFDVARGAEERPVRSARDLLRFQIWSYVHFPLYLSIAVLGVGVERVISLPTGARLMGQHAWILIGAASVLMSTMILVGLTSKRREADLPAWLRFLLLLTLLPAPWLSRVAPSCVLVVQVLLLCAVQVGLGRAMAYGFNRAKSRSHDCPEVCDPALPAAYVRGD
jgi:low temperature requirement protein LtrA